MEQKKGLEQKRNLSILAAVQAALSGLIIAGVILLYALNPSSLTGAVQIETLAGLAMFSLLYYYSLHRFLVRLHQAASTLVLSVVTGINVALLILQTGGLDSPFYALWLVIIVTSGMFGTVYNLIVLGATLAIFGIAWALNGFTGVFLATHSVQLLASVAAGILAEFVYFRSLSSQKQVVNALSGQLGEEQLKAQVLMQSMADGVVVVDAGKKIVLINHAAQAMTGWDEKAAQGIDYRLVLKLRDTSDKEITDQNDPFSESWSLNKSAIHNEYMLSTKSADRKIALSVSISPIYNTQNEISGGIAVFRDISKEKEVERTRNEFVSTASHEMRTPVAAIEGYIALAMNPKVATIDDRAMGYLQKAHDNTQHLGALFRDLLSVTKIDEGIIAKNITPVNLTQMLQDIANDMQFAASKKNLSITFMGGEADTKTIVPAYWVRVDAERMREVIMNLIENGMKFTKEGGITLIVTGDDKTVTVKVQDTGIGIPAEDITHLFQKFYRVDNSATRTIGGTGLGLYLCRTLIELFSGRIWVESEFGKGSTFIFELPRTPEPAAQATPVQTQPASIPATLTPLQPIPVTATSTASSAQPSVTLPTQPAALTPVAIDTVTASPLAAPQVSPVSVPVASQ